MLAFAVLSCASRATAQSTFSQDVVVTAAATPVQFGTVTRTLTVITREQVAQLPAHSIADVLRVVGAVDVRARGERGVQTDFAVRGANFGQMLVLVDGMRLNDAQSGHHNGDIPVPLDAIERIEVLHGPGSARGGRQSAVEIRARLRAQQRERRGGDSFAGRRPRHTASQSPRP